MKILINKLILFGYHGVYDEEINKGQDFEISLEMKLENEINNDLIENTVDYSKIIEEVTEIFNNKRYNLLETLAKDICSRISLHDQVRRVLISIKKIKPPINATIESVEVQHQMKK